MRSSHTVAAVSAVFDDANLIGQIICDLDGARADRSCAAEKDNVLHEGEGARTCLI